MYLINFYKIMKKSYVRLMVISSIKKEKFVVCCILEMKLMKIMMMEVFHFYKCWYLTTRKY